MNQTIKGKSDEIVDALQPLLDLSFHNDEPLYAQITRKIRELIETKRLPEGMTLPSERRLADILNVSRITAQNSYNELRQQGFITSHGRRGSVVRYPNHRITSPMNRLRAFTEEMEALGRIPSSRIVRREIRRDRKIATILGLSSNADLLYLERVRYADGVALSNEKAWYNLQLVPALVDCDLSVSTYRLLADFGYPLAYCDQIIEAILPSEDDCRIFNIEMLTPCMLIKRQSFDKDGQMLEYVEGTFRGDVYSYRLTLAA